MTIRPIFSELPIEIDTQVIGYTDPQSRVRLSGSCRAAYQRLSNEKYFWQQFAREHFLLGETDRVFLQFRTYYPEYCWKAAYILLQKDYPFFKNFFFDRTVPTVPTFAEDIKAEKKAHKSRFNAFYTPGDPKSSIHRMEAALFQEQVRFTALRQKVAARVSERLRPFEHTLGRYLFSPTYAGVSDRVKMRYAKHELFQLLVQDKCLQLLSKDVKEIEKDEMSQYLDLNLIDEYRREILPLVKLHRKLVASKNAMHALSAQWGNLEAERKVQAKEWTWCKLLLRKVNNPNKILKWHHLYLLIDLYFAKNPEGFMSDINKLRSAYQEISNFLFHESPFDTSKRSSNELIIYYRDKLIINSCKTKDLIWEILYHQCGNGAPEDEWVENHFHEFLFELSAVLRRLHASAVSYRAVYFHHLDLCLRPYVAAHFDSLAKELVPLQLLRDALKQHLPSRGTPCGIGLLSYQQISVIDGALSKISGETSECLGVMSNSQNLVEDLHRILLRTVSLIGHIEKHPVNNGTP